MLTIYTDGSCLSNPGPGGWAFIAYEADGTKWVVSGGSVLTTNNRMELTAVVNSLQFFSNIDITIYSDSRYVIDGATKYINSWRLKDFDGIKNPDLWENYDIASRRRNIEFIWVKGHSGNLGNEEVDKMAKSEANQMKTQNQ